MDKQTVTMSGQWSNWVLFDKTRQHGTVQNLPFVEAKKCVQAVRYNGQTGKGSQRELMASHARKLKSEMENGTYTPTPVSANCSAKQREKLVLKDDSTFTLEVNCDDPLQQSDGQHRFGGLSLILDELTEKLAKAEDGKDKEKLQRWLEQAEQLPVTVTVYFDGNVQEDFVRLQAGRAVDAAHMLSMKVQRGIMDDPSFKLGFAVAKLLHKDEKSPLSGSIRFDSRGNLPMPISSLCSKGSSDIGTSLIGLARLGLSATKPLDASHLAGAVTAAYQALQKGAPELLEYGKVLAPLSNQGTKGGTTMLIGLGVVLAYRLVVTERVQAKDEELKRLVLSAKETLDKKVDGNFSGSVKRTLLGEFAREFLADMTVDKHDGLPVGLLRTLSASTFAAEALPAEAKKPKVVKTAKAKKKANRLPDIDSPLPQEEPRTAPAIEEKAPWEGELAIPVTSEPWAVTSEVQA